MNVKLLKELNGTRELIPDEHDGSYELMRATIDAYANVDNFEILDYNDLNAVYLMSVGTWKHGIDTKKNQIIYKSHLNDVDKQLLCDLIDKIQGKSKNGLYSNHQGEEIGRFGMFGTGFFSFQNKTDVDSVKSFIRLCVEIKDIKEDDAVFDKAQLVLNGRFRGMKAASASMVLHCLKPDTFPIFCGGGLKTFRELDILLKRATDVDTYIENSRKIKQFRDKNLPFKNYRILDMAAWTIDNSPEGKENSSEKDVEKPIKSKPKNLILYGPPGTGKTYNTVNYAVAILESKTFQEISTEASSDHDAVLSRYEKYKNAGRVAFTTFHPSYGYEEFIEGIRPVVQRQDESEASDVKYEYSDGIFKGFCLSASDLDEPVVFIIDEINRGNISKIFGELITLIEDTKRIGTPEEVKAILPYTGELFGVPNNVHLLGTMNTADRSIALMDTALRRRFDFIEMMPKADVLTGLGITEIEGVDVAKMLEAINQRIEYLFDREHTIGHSYFTALAKESTIDKLASIFLNSVVPLLQEYFYEDYGKIQLVLGDNGKTEDQYKFVLDYDIKIRDIFKGSPDIDLPEKKYSIQTSAFYEAESYRQIY